jgi:hypothetical protein
MQKLLFSGMLGSLSPEATPKLYPLHPKLRMNVVTISPLLGFLQPIGKDIKISVLKLAAPAPHSRYFFFFPPDREWW